ncbi:MAG: hypothetical protein FJY88_12900 [Candidatus Eisenbacteria bacterium]|nr:hypothetical protein [Candidatus Eisenbacteria bacterium]
MERRSFKVGPERHGKKKSHARPDRIIEKRQNWQEYLDPEEDPGLLDETDLVIPGVAGEAEEKVVEEDSKEKRRGKSQERDPERLPKKRGEDPKRPKNSA